MTPYCSESAFDKEEVREVLAARTGEWVAVSVISDDGAYAQPFRLPEQLDEAVDWVGRRAATTRTLSAGVATLSSEGAERLEDARRRGWRARPRHGEHTGYAWVAADLDPHGGEDIAVLRERLRRCPYTPSLLVSSGRGLHAWWRLTEPVDVGEGRRLCGDLARALDGDPGAAHEGRALRLPGTFNGKPGVQRLAALLEHDPTRRYPAAELSAAAVAIAPRLVAPAPRPRLLPGLRGGGDFAKKRRDGHDLADELDRVAGPRSGQHKWRCPTGHDSTASLRLHRDDPQRWVCFGGGHLDGFGRPTKSGQYSGDVVDLHALEASQSVEQFLSAERARLTPASLTRGSDRAGGPGTATSETATVSTALNEDIPLPSEPPTEEEPSRGPPRGGGKAGKKADQPSQADQLVQLARRDYTLIHSASEPYAVPRTAPRVALSLRGGGGLRAHLADAYWEKYGKVPTSGALADALNALEGLALKANPVDVGLRVATVARDRSGRPTQVALDLGDATGRAVVITPQGWRVVEHSPVVFKRTGLTSLLPEPVRGGTLDELRDLVNVTDETWPLMVGWLASAGLPDIPHPIALLTGEQGTGKSTAARLLVQLIDSSVAPLRSSPKDEQSWGVSAASSYVVGVDNISSIPAWWSDALCRAVTGDGLVRRKLYTDSDVSVLTLKRVVVLTGIDAGALRGDLTERLLTIELQPIDAKHRRTDRELDEAWRVAHPRLLGALLDLVCDVLRVLPAAAEDLAEHPRMADFAEVLLAVDRVTGSSSLDLYRRAGERLAAEVAESDPVAHAVLKLIELRADGWSGTTSQLLGALRQFVPDQLPRAWPVDATRLSSHLKRVQPALRASGVDVAVRRTNGTRKVVLTKLDPQGEVHP